MKIQTIFSMASPYRDDFRIKAYTFGEGEKTLCIVGSMRGDEIQQQYVASRMVAILKNAEEKGLITNGKSITVVPCVNPSSINIEKRFWALDGTDINRMFPGYDQGETTQRIAAGLFEFIKDFKFGIQLASYYLPGNFLPHVRMMKTGFEDVEDAHLFGFPYISVHTPEPFDTVLLNYNWQIWETQAFSLYAGTTDVIDHDMADMSIDAICRFMQRKDMLNISKRQSIRRNMQVDIAPFSGKSTVIDQSNLINIQAPHAGLFIINCVPGQEVKSGDVLARITHPYEGKEICSVTSPADGIVFFARNKSITFQNTLLFRIIKKETTAADSKKEETAE